MLEFFLLIPFHIFSKKISDISTNPILDPYIMLKIVIFFLHKNNCLIVAFEYDKYLWNSNIALY
jgi:hypothetical protein